MSRFVALLLSAAFVQSSAFVAPGASRPALRSSSHVEQMQLADMPEEDSSSPFGAVVMASLLGLMVGLSSGPQLAMAADKQAAPVVPTAAEKKAKLKAEVEKAQAAIKQNAKSREERLKGQIAQLKEVEKTASLDYATK